MTLPYRLTSIGWFYLNIASFAASLQFGDTLGSVNLKNRVLAIQRAVARFEDDELRFASYPLFFLPNPVPTTPPEAAMTSTSRTGAIEIGAVKILGVTASSLVRAGNGHGPHISESRIHHFRHYNAGPPVGYEYR